MKKLLAATAMALVAACATGPAGWPDGKAESAERFEAHVQTLAGDDYEGREAGERGYDKATAYVVAQFEAMGLAPAGTDGFLQQVPLRRATRVVDAMVMQAEVGGETRDLTVIDDYLLDAPSTSAPDADGAELRAEGDVVFVGYGIDAPGLGVDSYGGLDVAGKVVLMMQGVPDGLPSEERAHFARGSAKIVEAAERGAVAVLFIGTRSADEEGFAERMATWANSASNTFAGRDAEREGVVSGYIFKDAARRLLTDAGVDHDVIITPDEDGKIAPLAIDARLVLETAATFDNYDSPNVIAMIEGSDPSLTAETVILSAHLDHEGVGEADEDDPEADTIFNGALDNATGIATMLEAARRFTEAGEVPKRTVMFAAVTAEEKGLLGSDYLARNPTIASKDIVANVNLDMPVLLYEFDDVIAFGAEHSSMGPIVREAAESMGVALTPDPYPDMVLFVRSDHYSFVKQGVPSVFLFLGTENGGEDAFKSFMSTHYHRVSDQTDLPILWEQGAKFAELNFRIAQALANADEAPAWNEDDFFGDLYAN